MELKTVWKTCQRLLERPEGPWRLPVLATAGPDGAAARVVVLRSYRWPQATMYTDSRTPKVEAVEADPRVSLVFYDPDSRVQMRLQGKAEVITSGREWEEALSSVSEGARADYFAERPPGATLEKPEDLELDLTGGGHFALIKIELFKLEWLKLRREGHLRAFFQGPEEGRWLVP